MISSTLFTLIFVVFSYSVCGAVMREYHHDVRLRDHGTAAYATVTKKYKLGRSMGGSYYINYRYYVAGDVHPLQSTGHDADNNTYYKYNVGDKIPIKINPDDVTDSRLDIPGDWNNIGVELYCTTQFFLSEIGIGLLTFALWVAATTAVNSSTPPREGS
jgi:hypothetical protein